MATTQNPVPKNTHIDFQTKNHCFCDIFIEFTNNTVWSGRREEGLGEGWGWVVVVVVRTVCFTCMSVHTRTRMQLMKMDQCQCTGPFGCTDQPAKALRLSLRRQVPGVPGANLTQPQGEEKDCEARPPHPPLLRRKGGAIFSISSALDALDPDCHEKIYLDVSSR